MHATPFYNHHTQSSAASKRQYAILMEPSLFFSDNEQVQEMPAPNPKNNRHKYNQILISSIKNAPMQRGTPICKQEQPISSNIMSNTSTPSECEVTKDSLHLLYFDYSDRLDSITYNSSVNQPEFFFFIFNELLDDLKYRKSNQPSSSKLRASIVKRGAEQYVREVCGKSVKKESQRMTETDRLLFQRANIEPPCNVNAEYIARLFSLPPFRKFFIEYVREDRVAEHYLRRVYEQVVDLMRFVERCSNEDHKQRAEGFMRLRKPMALSEVPAFEMEARRIVEQFCRGQ